MNLSKFYFSLLIIMLSFYAINPAAHSKSLYCIQIETFSKKESRTSIIKKAEQLKNKYTNVMAEEQNNYYVLEIGFFKDLNIAKNKLILIRKRFHDAFIKKCGYPDTKWIYPQNIKKSKAINKHYSSCYFSGNTIKQKTAFKDPALVFREIFKKYAKNNIKNKNVNNKPYIQEKSKTPVISAKKFFFERYVFLDGYDVWGQDPRYLCQRKGREIAGKAGIKFSWQLTKGMSLWGDLFGGLTYQSFMRSSRKRGWIDIRYLYLSTKSIYEPNYYGFYASLGRMPVIDKRGFWFYNYLDGIRGGYKSTLLNCFIFAGKRLKDNRVGNSEEKTNIQGYNYILGRINYQYFYKQHAGLFYILENQNKFSNLNKASVWKGVRNKENINWIGLRLNGSLFASSLNNTYYWLDLGYMWGKRGFSATTFKGCTAYKKVSSTIYENERGFGVEAGGKKLFDKTGIGARIAAGQGSNPETGNKNFYLPKISTTKDRLFGLNRIRYYGELTDPDLNNIVIFSIFGGYKWKPDNWIELNLLKYLKYNKQGRLPFDRYFTNTNNSKDIGYEMDLMFDGQIKTINDKWKYLVTGSVFFPGSAFNGLLDKKNAYGIFVKIKRYW